MTLGMEDHIVERFGQAGVPKETISMTLKPLLGLLHKLVPTNALVLTRWANFYQR